MGKIVTLFKTELLLAVREFSGVLFGMIMPLGGMVLLGIIYGNRPAFEGADYTLVQQSFPAVMTIGICASGLMGIPLTVAAYREKGILKRFKVTPSSPLLLLGAQFMTNFVFAVLSSGLVFGAAALLFKYELRGSLLPFLGSCFLILVSLFSLGFLIASISGTVKTANLLCTLLYFPMLFLSGATIPFEIMPTGLQKISGIMPLTQGIMLLKAVSLDLSGFSPLKPIIILMAVGVISLIVSLKTFRWD